MSFLIVIRFDSAGACPVVVREDDELFSSDGARWRLVAQTDDPAEAARLVEILRQRRDAGELAPDGGSGWSPSPTNLRQPAARPRQMDE